jgi:hypothetical protein
MSTTTASLPRRFEWALYRPRLRWTALWVGLAVLAALPLLYLYLNPGSLTFDTTQAQAEFFYKYNSSRLMFNPSTEQATFHFETANARIIFPGQCVTLSWDVQHVAKVFINRRGHIGTDSKVTCNADTPIPTMWIIMPNKTEYQFTLPVEQLYYHPIVAGLWVVIAAGLAAAAYNLFGLSGSIFVLTAFLFWSSTQTWIEIGLDWNNHTKLQQMVHDTGNLNALPPHFLYHVLGLSLAALFPGMSLQGADLIVIVAAYGLGSVAMYWLLRTMIGEVGGSKIRQALIYIPLTLSLWCVVPLQFSLPVMQTWNATPYIPVNMFNIPTFTILKPLAVLIFVGVVKWITDAPQRRWLPVFGVAIVTVGATLAKPNYTMAILPVMALLLAVEFLRPFRLNRTLIIAGVIIPAVAVLLWQYLRVYAPGAAATAYNPNQGAGIILTPLALYVNYWHYPIPQFLTAFALSMAFPIVVYLAYFKAAIRNLTLNLGWLVFLIGQTFALLFLEVTYEAAGNFTWGGRITLFVLFVCSLGFLIRQNAKVLFAEKRLPLDPRFYLCAAVFILHLIPYLQYAHVKPSW